MTNDFFAQLVHAHGNDSAIKLGPYASYTWRHDPKHHFFTLARYKFCSKMLAGRNNVLDVGCGDGTGHPLLLQTVGFVFAVDVNPVVIQYNQAHNFDSDRISYNVYNIIDNPISEKFDCAISLDVIEHLPKACEDDFVRNIAASLEPNAPAIFGTPNVTANAYASDGSKSEHINLQSHQNLTFLLSKYFYNVFLFSMNDEIVHTGFYPMAHYFMAIAVGPR